MHNTETRSIKEVMLWSEKDLLVDLNDFQHPLGNLYGAMHLEQ